MFTGIIKNTSKIRRISTRDDIVEVSISRPLNWKIKVGESVSVNGVCSTIASINKDTFLVEYMPETIRTAAISSLKSGIEVNLERSLVYGDRVDGHFVTGHIDTVGRVVTIDKNKRTKKISIHTDKNFNNLVAYKGSVTINGVALTVSKKSSDNFEISLIPYTLDNTNLDKLEADDSVNIEFDLIAKYINAKRTKNKKTK